VAASRQTVETVRLAGTSHPRAWEWSGFPKTLLPTTTGEIRATVRVPRAADYSVWLGGSVRPRVDLEVDGRPRGEVRRQLNNEGEYVLLGRARLSPGGHRLAIDLHGADLSPGSGGEPSPVGPLVLTSQDAAATHLVRLDPRRASSLCGARWDWIEAVASRP
jgi:hypothetical protein